MNELPSSDNHFSNFNVFFNIEAVYMSGHCGYFTVLGTAVP